MKIRQQSYHELDAARIAYVAQGNSKQKANILIRTRLGAVVYYVSTETWQYRGRVWTGTLVELVSWLKAGKLLQ